MIRGAAAIIFFLCSMQASAACNLPLIAGEYSLFLKWDDTGYEGAVVGKLDVASGGRAVLRGAKLTYRNQYGNLTNREGSAVGRMGIAPQCTGVLELSLTDRNLEAEVAVVSANFAISGGRVDTTMSGLANVDIKLPGDQVLKSKLLGSLILQRLNL